MLTVIFQQIPVPEQAVVPLWCCLLHGHSCEMRRGALFLKLRCEYSIEPAWSRLTFDRQPGRRRRLDCELQS